MIMKITNYKKKKNNTYEITFDNKSRISLFDDVILKYNLLIDKEINEKKLKEIVEFNSYLESYNIAIKYISVKLRTEKEIVKRLKNYSKEAINYTLDRLKKEGLLNDELYIKSYINDSVNLKIEGPNKILFDLKKLGFKDSDILNYLDTFESEIWFNKINKVINKKINSNHNLSGFMLKQKITQELFNKGFNKEDINSIIEEYGFSDNENIYEKEYEKLKNKLSTKYNGEELEYRIKIGMMKKGFRH